MEFQTVLEASSACLTEKRSKFIATLSPAGSEAEARQVIDRVRSQYPDARHHVFAYRLFGGAERCSDDGEPQGTGGAPVLDVMKKRGLFNVVTVVTRYFGGVLLGAPGLTRAYSRAAVLAADAARIAVMRRCRVYDIRVDYAFLAGLERMVRELGGRIRNAGYGADVRLEAVVPEEDASRFESGVIGCTAGKTSPVQKSETFCSEENDK